MLPLKMLPGMIDHTCNHRAQEVEAEASLATKIYIRCFRVGWATQRNCLKTIV